MVMCKQFRNKNHRTALFKQAHALMQGLELLIYLEGVTGASAAATQGAAPAASSAAGPSTGSAGAHLSPPLRPPPPPPRPRLLFCLGKPFAPCPCPAHMHQHDVYFGNPPPPPLPKHCTNIAHWCQPSTHHGNSTRPQGLCMLPAKQCCRSMLGRSTKAGQSEQARGSYCAQQLALHPGGVPTPLQAVQPVAGQYTVL